MANRDRPPARYLNQRAVKGLRPVIALCAVVPAFAANRSALLGLSGSPGQPRPICTRGGGRRCAYSFWKDYRGRIHDDIPQLPCRLNDGQHAIELDGSSYASIIGARARHSGPE